MKLPGKVHDHEVHPFKPKHTFANSADPDEAAVSSVSTLFAIMLLIVYLNPCNNGRDKEMEGGDITKTRLYNFDPLKPHFYIVKLGFTGVCVIFLICAQNIDCGYSLEPPHRGGSNEYPQSMF